MCGACPRMTGRGHRHCEEQSDEAIHLLLISGLRSLSSGAHSRGP